MTEEAKRCVEIMHERGCRGCLVKEISACVYREEGRYCDNFYHEAADLIESLSAQLEQVTRERDVAVEALRDTACCSDCKNYATQMDSEPCKTCLMCPSQSKPNWQWRGVEVRI